MAIRYAVAAGNWSATATWNGGTLPANGDDVYANNFAVNIDQSVSPNSLKTISNASPVITAGGSFTVTAAATVTIAAGIATADSGASNAIIAVNAGSAAVTITATSNGFTGGAAASRAAISVTSGYTGTLTINGAITGGSSSSGYGLTNAAACTINITGAISGGTGSGVLGVNNTANATISVTGNITGGSISSAHAFSTSGTSATINVTGNVTGGGSSTYGLNISGASALVTVAGNVTGGSGSGAFGINQTAGALTVRGTLTPGTYASGAQAISAATVFRYSGHIYSGGMSINTGPNGFLPFTGTFTGITNEEIYLHIYDDGNYPSGNNGTQRILTRYGTNNPAVADVRSGTVYGASGLLTGTLAVPPAASVASGVAVDATTGTAALKLSDVAAVTGAQVAAVFP